MNQCVLDTSVASLMYDASPLYLPYDGHVQSASIFVSFQTVGEMRFGARKSSWGIARRQRLEAFLTSLQVVGYTDELAHHWAQIMHEAQTVGRRLEAGDGWIAATALLLNAPLLTHDKDFDAQACPSITIVRYTP